MIRVLLVDDHELVRDDIKFLLKDAENMNVIGEAKMERLHYKSPSLYLGVY